MSVSALTWLVLAGTLLMLSLWRPAYAVALYMMTFFAAPKLWWWGGALPSLRYAVLAGITLLGAVLLHFARTRNDGGRRFNIVHFAAIGMVVNATFVHFALASVPSVSINNYVELLKYVLLFFLIARAIRTTGDLRVVIMAIAIGAGYIGYEVTFNERGDFRGSRLEGIGAPGADTSNSLASVMLLSLPLIGSLLVEGKRRHKLTAVIAAPLVLNLILLCNSRGAFLGLIGAGVTVLLIARGVTRKRALKAMALASVALFLLLGDPKIMDRFATTFVGSEERDASAASRLQFWQAGLLMIRDYPLGDGGGSFKFVHGGVYLLKVTGEDVPERSLHNGYLTEATEWGIQGLLLRLVFVFAACVHAFRTTVRSRQEGRGGDSLMGICFIAALTGFLIATVFGSFMSNEWSYWIVALLVRYGELYRVPAVALSAQTEQRNPVGLEATQWGATSKAV